jgi:hypothetical protein
MLKHPMVKWHIKQNIKKMMRNGIRPTIQINKNENNTLFELYRSSYKSINWNHYDEHSENLYYDILRCNKDNPNKFINLIGYSLFQNSTQEYLADMRVIYIPNNKTSYFYYLDSNEDSSIS